MVDTSIIGVLCSDPTELKLRSLTKVSSINAVCKLWLKAIASTKICKNLVLRSKSQKKFCLQFIQFSVTVLVKIPSYINAIYSCEVHVISSLAKNRSPPNPFYISTSLPGLYVNLRAYIFSSYPVHNLGNGTITNPIATIAQIKSK